MGRKYLAQSQRIIGGKCSCCRVTGQKNKFSNRHAELGAVKVKKKKKKGRFRLFFLASLFSGKGTKKKKKKNSFLFFSLSLQQDSCPPCLEEKQAPTLNHISKLVYQIKIVLNMFIMKNNPGAKSMALRSQLNASSESWSFFGDHRRFQSFSN